MQTLEHVKLNSDTNYIHVKWVIMEVSIGGTLGGSNAWIKCVSYGWDNADNLLAFKLTSEGYKPALENGKPVKQDPYTGVDTTGRQGTIGEYRVVSLSDISPYNRGGKIDFTPNIPIG